MRRSYDYHSSSSYSAMDEYLERINRIQRMPSMIADTPQFPNVHEVLNNHPVYANPKENDDQQQKTFNKNHHQKNHQNPEAHKKVHFVEHEKKKTEVGRDGKPDIVEEKTVDVEADGFIQQKHKGFELCKWDTFKLY